MSLNRDNNPLTRDVGDRSDTDTNAQDQMLLKALQEFLVPVVKPEGMRAMNLKGPEAMNLITALKAFVSTTVGGTVREHEAHRQIQIKQDNIREESAVARNDDTSAGITRSGSLSTLSTHMTSSKENDDIFREKLLNKLQEHVSNKMPIRLLLIQPRGSDLHISLIERGAIFAYLENIVYEKNPTLCYDLRSGETEEDLIKQLVQSYANYAILSHKWLRGLPGEITYNHWNEGSLDPSTAGYDKLASFCRTAWKDYGITLAWMDTICINKDSSSELDESIRSMYAWYERASVCIVYLAETMHVREIPQDSWFTRGWTLQEFIAPNRLKFYGSNWKCLENNDKEYSLILRLIKETTKISSSELTCIAAVPMSRRMEWAATREVTREEDMAYSLMGIFNVSISIAYGEGADRAFLRLLEEIMKTTPEGAMDLFNWAGDMDTTGYTTSLLPSSPKYYIHRSTQVSLHNIMCPDPLILTPRGIRVPFILMPGVFNDSRDVPRKAFGGYSAITTVSWPDHLQYIPRSYCLLDKRISGRDGYHAPFARGKWPWYLLTFAVFNFKHSSRWIDDKAGVYLSTTCIAIVLQCAESVGRVTGMAGEYLKFPTTEPVVFKLDLEPHMMPIRRDGDIYIEVDDLARHGMQLVSMYM